MISGLGKERARAQALVSLGSNVEPAANLRLAAELLRREAAVILSSAWETAPVGPAGQPPFINAAALLDTDLPPDRLKTELLRPLEARLGRRRGADRFAPRPIDLDLLAYRFAAPDSDLLVLDDELFQRAHLAVPAAELAPAWRDPVSGETLAATAARLTAGLPPELWPRNAGHL